MGHIYKEPQNYSFL